MGKKKTNLHLSKNEKKNALYGQIMTIWMYCFSNKIQCFFRFSNRNFTKKTYLTITVFCQKILNTMQHVTRTKVDEGAAVLIGRMKHFLIFQKTQPQKDVHFLVYLLSLIKTAASLCGTSRFCFVPLLFL